MIPQHAEKISPPRTLAVPYPLGRPLGIPGDAEFQHRVLGAALNLLLQSEGLVFEEYQEDVPDLMSESEETWVCPVSFANPNKDISLEEEVLGEMTLLQPWYDKGRDARSTSVGVSGMELEDAVKYIGSFLNQDVADQIPDSDMPTADRLKYAVEDIKAFYNEAATSQPGTATVQELEDWYWGETNAGKLVRAVKQVCADHEDSAVKIAAAFLLVPGSQVYRDQA